MKDMLRISVLCIGFFLLLGRVDGQVLSPKQAYQLTIHQNVQEGATHNVKKPKPVDFLFWDKVKQGEDLYFTIAIKAKKALAQASHMSISHEIISHNNKTI